MRSVQAIPRSVVIGGRRIKLRVIKDKEDWGEYHHDEGIIEISSRALNKASDLRETLRHEIFEAALHIGGVAFSEKYDQEVVVRCIEGIFFPCWDKFTVALSKRDTSASSPAPAHSPQPSKQ